MSLRAQIIAISIALFMLLLVLELVRRRRLRVDYSLGWLATGIGMIVLFALPGTVSMLARLMGVQQPQSLLYSAGIAFSLWILLGQSLALTKLWRQDKNMAQQHALLEWRFREMEAELDELRSSLQPQRERVPREKHSIAYASEYSVLGEKARDGGNGGDTD